MSKNRLLFTLFTVVLVGSMCKMKQDIRPLTKSWEFAIPNQEVPEGLAAMNASYCGTCHRDHYEEWKLSTHAHAWTDLQFQAEIKKESSPFMCINCHIPLQNQQEYIVTGLIDGDIYKPVKEINPHFDEELQQEGITCASCHVRDGAIIGSIGSKLAPHKVVKDPEFLSEKLCISCHNASAELTETLVCTFETGDEWKAGPYFGKQNCISCHMEEVERPLVAGLEKRVSHRHFFAGSGIPKFDTVTTKMLNGLAIYPTAPQATYQPQDSILAQIRVKNEHAGHRVPTGDPERFFLIHFDLLDEKGDTIQHQQYRIGEKWQRYPTAKKLAD
ncbi:MAG: multiheme c-type cytochrome, partial [Bacteroidota bacterium]